MSLMQRFAASVRATGGHVGAVILDPGGAALCALDADGLFPAASVIKLPLVMTLFADAAEGRLSLEERLEPGERADGSGVLRDLRDVDAVSLRDLAALALTVSDNTATNRLIERIGTGRVNERLDEWGCPRTRLRRAMFDLQAKARGLENVMTPAETASLLSRVARGAAEGSAALREVVRLLERNTDRTRLGRYLPPSVEVAHKDGWMEGVDNDAGIVRAAREIVVVGFTAGLAAPVARSLLGLLGAAAAEAAGADVAGLSREAFGGP